MPRRSPTIRPLRFLLAVVAAVAAGVFGSRAAGRPSPAAELAAGERIAADLIVHEWGTFTTIADRDGAPVPWDPFDTVSDLPSFVRVGLPKTSRGAVGTVRMETPVLYFYANAPLLVSASVAFPKGLITEWYPDAARRSSGITWNRVEIWPGLQAALPTEPRPSHYYPARDTAAALVKVGGRQIERFLFYRGVGTFELPLTARVAGEQVVVFNSTSEDLGAAILFERAAGQLAYGTARLAGDRATLPRPRTPTSLAQLENTLAGLLVANGLYEKEARAMIASWRDSWFEEGLRLIYCVPRAFTDAVLPLAISPRPAEIERVLVGRVELLSPERAAQIEQEIHARDEHAPAATTGGAISGLGRFARPFLQQVAAATKSPTVKRRIEALIR
jgi:hypothetical protein